MAVKNNQYFGNKNKTGAPSNMRAAAMAREAERKRKEEERRQKEAKETMFKTPDWVKNVFKPNEKDVLPYQNNSIHTHSSYISTDYLLTITFYFSLHSL